MGLIAFAVLLTLLTPSARAETSNSAAPVVKTRQGEVRGVLAGSIREFFGIPYAAPPIGNLRWRSPQPHANWTDTLDTTRPGSSCVQSKIPGPGVAGSEDCLCLNVYTPTSAAKPLPVMVWIHGGTFVSGAGWMYDGSYLAEKGRLIVVTINYRLGPFGFLANRALDADEPGHVSGNYGLLDQLAALQWVKDNIASFDGDPAQVTVAGESAGAMSIGLHLVSPSAAGLFARGIIESGPFLQRFPMLVRAEAKGDEFAAKLGCTGPDIAACMRSKPADQVLRALPASPISIAEPVWYPTIDGRLIPAQPADAIAAGHVNKVPVINGSNRDEGTLFTAFAKQPTPQEYTDGVKFQFGDNAQRVLAAYSPSSYPSPAQAEAAGLGDALFSCRTLKTSELLSAYAPVYQYEFNDSQAPNIFTPNPVFPFRAYHGSEIQYVLGTVLKKSDSLSSAQRALADAMTGYWINFIGTGDPAGSPRWSPFTAADPRILSFTPGAIGYETSFAKTHNCDLWFSLERY